MIDTDIFIAALHGIVDVKNEITQTRLSELTGISQSTISGYVNRTSKPRKPGYKKMIMDVLVKELKLSEDEIERIGREQKEKEQPQKNVDQRLAKLEAALPHTQDAEEQQSRPYQLTEHQQMVEGFENKELGQSINQKLLEIEKLDPEELEDIDTIIDGKLNRLRKKYSKNQHGHQANSSAS